MKFTASFCDPFNPVVIDLGEIKQDHVISEFEKINWREYLEKMDNAEANDMHYSPSFEVTNTVTKCSLAISAVGSPNKHEFYTFYKRPKRVSFMFGLIKKLNEEYISDVTGQTRQEVIECLHALINNDTTYLEDKIGQ